MTRAWVEIDLGALLRNGASVRRRAGIPILPMVKADGYGLGAVRIAHALEALDPWGFGVATIPEGEELRRAGVKRPIIVFTPLLVEDLDAARRAFLTPALSHPALIERWAETRLPWHLAIDTGMSRSGVQWNEIKPLRSLLSAAAPAGAFTHFHSAQKGDTSRRRQEQRFARALGALPARPGLVHAENSPAIEHHAPSRWDLARPGVFLYGVGSGGAIVPEPVVSVRARIVDLRTIADGETVSYDGTFRAEGERRIATLGIGYADGYRRTLSNRGTVLVRGKRASIAGIVTMDMTMLDVTDIGCAVGDIATLVGDDGGDRLDLGDVALAAGLSPYELLTGLRGRLPRRYHGAE